MLGHIYGLYLKEMLLYLYSLALLCFFGRYSFPCRSLLLGTNVPNDIECILNSYVTKHDKARLMYAN